MYSAWKVTFIFETHLSGYDLMIYPGNWDLSCKPKFIDCCFDQNFIFFFFEYPDTRQSEFNVFLFENRDLTSNSINQ